MAATLVAYQIYALTAVPLLEPAAPTASLTAASDATWNQGTNRVGRYQTILQSYFPTGHWSLVGKPMVVDNGKMMLVLENYHRFDDGRVSLSKCAVVFFPTPRITGATPPRDAVIIEAPGGATLLFDSALSPGNNKIGRPVRGVFPGELVIRSDMHKPGPEDDLRIVTHDLRLEETLLFAEAGASFRLGPHSGSGRKLEIQLLRETDSKPGDSGVSIAGIASLELREGVEATLRLPKQSKLQAKPPIHTDARALPERSGWVTLAAAHEPEVSTEKLGGELHVTSAGPFRFDFTRFVASLQQEVRATMRNANGPSDQLYCSELRLYLADAQGNQTVLNPADEPDLAQQQGRLLGQMQPYLLEALGDPVRMDSPGRQASARGQRLKLWVTDRRLRIEGTPATLAQGLNETHAAWIDYRSPPENSPAAIGDLSMAGPGWLRVATRKDSPDKLIEARWSAVDAKGTEAVRLARDRNGQPMLLVAGKPEIAASGLGRIQSDRLSLRFREVAPDGADGPAIELGTKGTEGKLALLVHRIDATGNVRFRGRELEGKTEDLVAWFREMPAEERQRESRSSQHGSTRAEGKTKASDKLYRLTAGKVQVDVGLFGRRAEPTSLLCSDGVRFEEISATSGKEPLMVTGAELRVDGLHHKSVQLTVVGQSKGNQPGAVRAVSNGSGTSRPGFAQITAQGLRLWARDLHVDQATNRVWTVGPGNARMRLDSQLAAGKGLNEQGEATLRWKGGLEFDGSQITLRDDVFVEASSGWIHTKQLTARLNRPISLTGGSSPGEGIDIVELECEGGVSIDQRMKDELGQQQSHQRARLSTLRINRLTGALSGEGPGWIRSVHYSNATESLGSLPGAKATPTAVAPAKLRYLRVNFHRGISGNLNNRAIRFHERVRGVYGPVLAWDQELPVESSKGVPPDAVTLECDELRLHEDPAAKFSGTWQSSGKKMGPLEMRALGSVRIEGASHDRANSFTAEASSASYTQLKEVFVLEGGADRDATLWLQQNPNQPPARSVARKISYDRRSGRVKVEDIRGFQYQGGAASSRR